MNPVQSVFADKESLVEDKAKDKMASILILYDQPYVRKLVSKADMKAFLFGKHPELYNL
jgi:hypothetical protein